jgi:hypothetical protein
LEILAKDGRDLMNLDFIQIPASGSDPLLKISRTPVTDADFLSIWYWLVATGDPEVSFAAGAVSRVGNSVPVAGLSGEFFPTNNFTGTSAVLPGVAPYTSGSTSSNVVSGVQVLSIRWSGEFVPQKTGSYVFTVAGVDDVVNVWMGGTQVVTNNSPLTFTVAAQAGVAVPIRIDWDDRGGGLRSFILDVTPPGEVRRRVAESDFRSSGNLLAAGTSTTSAGRAYLLQRMGYREATAAEVLRAKEAGNPGVVLQWDPKLRVGPDERPWKVNQYGFETSATGYWLVPVSGN